MIFRRVSWELKFALWLVAAEHKLAAARQIHARFFPLFKDLFIETNPTPVKAALAMMKLIEEEYRLPLVPMDPKNWDLLRTTLKRCDVLK